MWEDEIKGTAFEALEISTFRFRDLRISRLAAESGDFPCPVAGGIGAAAPELLSAVHAFFGHAPNHRFAAEGAGGGIGLAAALSTVCQSFCRQSLRESALLLEFAEEMLYLSAQHLCQAVAEDEDAVGCREGIVGDEPLVELMLLRQDVYAALVLHVVAVGRAVELDADDLPVFRRPCRPGEALVA